MLDKNGPNVSFAGHNRELKIRFRVFQLISDAHNSMDGTEALPWSLRLIVGDICGILVGTGGNSNSAFMTARFCLQRENKKKRVGRERERTKRERKRRSNYPHLLRCCVERRPGRRQIIVVR